MVIHFVRITTDLAREEVRRIMEERAPRFREVPGLVLAGVFPAVDASGNLSYDSLGHTVASFMAFLGSGGGFILMSRRLADDPSCGATFPPTCYRAISRSWS